MKTKRRGYPITTELDPFILPETGETLTFKCYTQLTDECQCFAEVHTNQGMGCTHFGMVAQHRETGKWARGWNCVGRYEFDTMGDALSDWYHRSAKVLREKA